MAFAFLSDIKQRLGEVYSARELANARAFGLKTFTSELKEKLVRSIVESSMLIELL